MAERRMTNVMNQRQGFNQLFIQLKSRGSRAGDLRHFNRMRQSAAEVIGVPVSKNLRFSSEAAEGSRMNNSIAIALKSRAIGVGIFRMLARGQGIGSIADHCTFAERSRLHERGQRSSARSEPRVNLLSPA